MSEKILMPWNEIFQRSQRKQKLNFAKELVVTQPGASHLARISYL